MTTKQAVIEWLTNGVEIYNGERYVVGPRIVSIDRVKKMLDNACLPASGASRILKTLTADGTVTVIREQTARGGNNGSMPTLYCLTAHLDHHMMGHAKLRAGC